MFYQIWSFFRLPLKFNPKKQILPEIGIKETALERADFTLQLSMFVTAEKEGHKFIILFLSILCQLLSPRF